MQYFSFTPCINFFFLPLSHIKEIDIYVFGIPKVLKLSKSIPFFHNNFKLFFLKKCLKYVRIKNKTKNPHY